MKRLLTGVTAILLGAAAGWGQSERGNITGLVSDSSGAAIAGARVAVTREATNSTVTLTSTSTGEYNAPNLPPAAYRIEVTAPGFKRFVQEHVTVGAGATLRLDAQLQVGQVSESIEVSAAVVQIQTENAKVSSAVQNKLVDELPLVVGGALRSVYNLVAITPEAKGSGGSLSLGGGQAGAWDATLDGLSATTNRAADATENAYLSPSIEAITEFAVDTNGFKAEYGQAGGGVMTFVSKSGTNQMHGSVYDFLRNDALDARGFFAASRAVYKQNDFGASFGAPVYLPRIYNGRNRTFFFIAYEGFRNRVGSNSSIFSVPTPEMYSGDFSNWVDAAGKPILIYDPATTRPAASGTGFVRDPFPGNQVPAAKFSALSKSILPFAQKVTPNRPGLTPGTSAYVRNNYISTGGSLLSPQNKGSLRVDQNLKNAHHIGFFYNRSHYQQELGPGGAPGLPLPLYSGQVSEFEASTYRGSYDWTISPRLLNHLSAGVNRFAKDSFSPNVGGNWKQQGICEKNVVDCNVNFPIVSFSEFSTWGSSADNGTGQPSWALKDDLSYIRGKHTLKFGYAFESQRANGFGQQAISGTNGFSFQGTSVPAATSVTSGSSFASFLLGDAASGGTETIRLVPQYYRYHGMYAQDDWRVNRKVTVNLGLRYEFSLAPYSPLGLYSDFTPDKPNPAVNDYPGALRFAGTGPGREGTNSLVPGWFGGLGPRVGIAYAPDAKTTVRSAFGRSFSKVTVVGSSGHYAGFIGLYSFATPDQGVTPAFQWDQGLPPYPLPPRIDPAFANNNNVDYWQPQDAARAPESLYWTFSVQRQLTANTVLEAEYNASVGTHLQTGLVNLNQVPTIYLSQFVAQYGTTAALNLLRSDINSAAARAAGIPIPYANFTNPAVQQVRTVNQALRPFPQYQTITTGAQGGDKSGHSNYQALVIKAERRFSRGLMFQWNYRFSKLLTDSDSYSAGGAAQDQYNRGLEKSIGQFDQTHSLKFNTVYELPFGRGKRWLASGLVERIAGGWRLSAIQVYNSGYPIALSRNNPLPIFNGATRPLVGSYDNWRAPIKGDKFDPNVDLFLNAAVFPTQPAGFGNATRYNPKVRAFPSFNENVGVSKSFRFGERVRADFRAEAFNLFNRTVFGTGSTNLNSNTFGLVTNQANEARQMQLAVKLYW